jgi:putative FmdB family regulatory protein
VEPKRAGQLTTGRRVINLQALRVTRGISMPIYEYQCQKCGTFEVTQRITEKPLGKCPTCKGKVKKLISNTSFQLKGTGWYLTDYARKDKDKGVSKGENGAKASTESKSESKTDSKTESKTEKTSSSSEKSATPSTTPSA